MGYIMYNSRNPNLLSSESQWSRDQNHPDEFVVLQYLFSQHHACITQVSSVENPCSWIIIISNMFDSTR